MRIRMYVTAYLLRLLAELLIFRLACFTCRGQVYQPDGEVQAAGA